jgi:hypothetical protein
VPTGQNSGALRKIVEYVGGYYRSSFSPAAFLILCLFLAGSIAINYSVRFEANYIAQPPGSVFAFGKYVLFYLLAFGFAFALEVAFKKERAFLKSPLFWSLLLGAPVLFATRELGMGQIVGLEPGAYWTRIVGVILGWVVAGVPIYLYWRATRGAKDSFYGFSKKNIDLRPYWVMLALMVPLVAIASFKPDFLETYPRAESLLGMPKDPAPSTLAYGIYELVYGLDFVFIEFFFRGFVVLALARICGASVILPMAAFYVFIHFEKPMGEAISSFFGGLLLGIISFETRSIYGGLIVHLGVAWMMELFAFGQKAIT